MLEPEFTKVDMASGSLAHEKLTICGEKHTVLFPELNREC